MKNKINWMYLLISIVVSIALGFLYSKFWTINQKFFWAEFIMNSLSFSAIPGLVIACMVILSVKDVQDELMKINEYVSVLNDFENDAKVYFYQNYNNNDGFKGFYTLLDRELELFIKGDVGENKDGVLQRIISESRECAKYIKNFKYVDAYLKNIESRKNIHELQNEENLTKDGVYLSFSYKTKDELISLLNKLYSEKKILETSELDKLSELLSSYNGICRTLYNKILSEAQLYPSNSTAPIKEEGRIDE